MVPTKDRDSHLALNELHPTVASIGLALGLPAQGSSPDSDPHRMDMGATPAVHSSGLSGRRFRHGVAVSALIHHPRS
ncbi:hypothetical protein ACFXTH_011856 [Malus domestica]